MIDTGDDAGSKLRVDCRGGLTLHFIRRDKGPPPHLRRAARRRHEVGAWQFVRDTGAYNCAGHVLGGRRGWLDCDETEFHDLVLEALASGGYVEVFDPGTLKHGDVVTFSITDEISHIALVTAIPDLRTGSHWLTSKLWVYGEYIHPIDAPMPGELGVVPT